MSAHILAEQFTTGDVARALGVTDEGVRYLEREAYLHAARTPCGWRLFQKGDVLRLADRRTEARLRSVKRLRPKKFGPRGGPRQLSFFAPRLRIVGRAPTLGKGQVDRARSRRKRSGSDNGGYGNRKATGQLPGRARGRKWLGGGSNETGAIGPEFGRA